MTHLLAFGLDETIARLPGETLGDPLLRQLEYASILETYRLVVRSLRPSQRQTVHLARNLWVYPTNSRNRLSFVADAVRLGDLACRQHPVDVLSVQDPFLTGLVGYVLKERHGLPLIIHFAGDMVDNPYWLREKRIYPLMNLLARWLIKHGDAFRVVSTSEKAMLMRMGVPADRIWNLGWISDFSRFIKADGRALRQRYLGHSYQSIVLFVGRLVPQKDLATMLRAVPKVLSAHPGVLFLLVGSGREEMTLRGLAQALGIESVVKFVGKAPYDQVPAYLAASDVFVLSSVYEGNARVLAEAAAAARPVVATDVSGTRDTVLDGETGYIVPVGESEALAEKIISLLDDPALSRRIGQRAQQHILQLYDTQRLLQGFREMWAIVQDRNP
jgi:glycosyltransferase involved in cell wall biosynthesis